MGWGERQHARGADEMLAGPYEPGGIIPTPGPALTSHPTDQQIRAAALQAAATWLSGVDPFPTGQRFLIDTADQLATWITTGTRP